MSNGHYDPATDASAVRDALDKWRERYPLIAKAWSDATSLNYVPGLGDYSEKNLRDAASAALDGERLTQPYIFKGVRCSLTQLRVLIADDMGLEELPDLRMDERWVYVPAGSMTWAYRRRIQPDGTSRVEVT